MDDVNSSTFSSRSLFIVVYLCSSGSLAVAPSSVGLCFLPLCSQKQDTSIARLSLSSVYCKLSSSMLTLYAFQYAKTSYIFVPEYNYLNLMQDASVVIWFI